MLNFVLNVPLSVPQMKLGRINKVLIEDYHCRRQMMITRFQVTLESFAWGEKQKVGAHFKMFPFIKTK